MGSDQKVIVPDSRGEDIINSEIQIMTSLDVALQAATNIGPANILAKAGGGNNLAAAAGLIRGNLLAEPAGKGSSVIVITFKHPDSQIVQPVLEEVISDYFQKHREIHSVGGQFDDALAREGTALSAQLDETEQRLAIKKNEAKIVSLDDSRKGLTEQISKIQAALLDAKADLIGYEAALKPASGAESNEVATATNAVPTSPVPPDQIDAYKSICANLDALRKKEQDYLVMGFTSSNSFVVEVNEQIANKQKDKDDLQSRYPQITDLGISSVPTAGSPTPIGLDSRAQAAHVVVLQAKISALNSQLDELERQATNLNSLAPAITQLEQTKAIQEANYKNLATGIEKSHIDQALDTGKAPNIKWVQRPSPPGRDWKKTRKIVTMLAFGGVFAGLCWAFLIEFALDRSIRRPVEIETKLGVPLLLSIPDVRRNGHNFLNRLTGGRQPQLNPARRKTLAAASNTGTSQNTEPANESPVVSLERNPLLQPFSEALRDRLIIFFEVAKLTHKPKLVAVTSASKGAGVSTLAAGLAASLSETGDGNVLLVDMNAEQGAAQQFYHGEPSYGVEVALNSETKDYALVGENLYVVNGNSNNEELPRILPKRFSALIPKLKASEYDYIIFDMPPVSQTSLTSRLARLMDMVLLVVESEKSDREMVQQAKTWLNESGATVGAVLNKTRRYIPARLHQSFMDES